MFEPITTMLVGPGVTGALGGVILGLFIWLLFLTFWMWTKSVSGFVDNPYLGGGFGSVDSSANRADSIVSENANYDVYGGHRSGFEEPQFWGSITEMDQAGEVNREPTSSFVDGAYLESRSPFAGGLSAELEHSLRGH